jgi:hypothetical protein
MLFRPGEGAKSVFEAGFGDPRVGLTAPPADLPYRSHIERLRKLAGSPWSTAAAEIPDGDPGWRDTAAGEALVNDMLEVAERAPL